MKSEHEVELYQAELSRAIIDCEKCGGLFHQDCDCVKRFRFELACYEACIPRDFWYTKTTDVTHNVAVFKRKVCVYARKLRTARRNGYGLFLTGPNGVGKTMFISFILKTAIRYGFTAYYTTILQLSHDVKQCFDSAEARKRLDWLLTSDFLAIDEMGKEYRTARGDSFIRTEVERILKKRFDESLPTLLASNQNLSGFKKGNETIASIVEGKYEQVTMQPGDFRERLKGGMKSDMGYK